MEIYPSSVIYVGCPAHVSTGGPEATHQLCSTLCAQGLNAQMFYYGGGGSQGEDPVHSDFKKYNTTYDSDSLLDSPLNILILPETATFLFTLFAKMQKVIWWLSVDNYHSNLLITGSSLIGRGIRFFEIWNPFDCEHLVQSEYARQHLLFFGIRKAPIYAVTDYISEVFIKNSYAYHPVEKADKVLYNPRKGLVFTQKLIAAGTDIEFVPIQNMSQQQVNDIMKESKVYIDFGPHPGKDRMPREAALNHCCVITGRRGAAKYYEDIPIGEDYKFEDIPENIPKILERIRTCFTDYENCTKDFSHYRELITNSKQIFEEEVQACFKKVL